MTLLRNIFFSNIRLADVVYRSQQTHRSVIVELGLFAKTHAVAYAPCFALLAEFVGTQNPAIGLFGDRKSLRF